MENVRIKRRGYFGIHGSKRVCLLDSNKDYKVCSVRPNGDLVVDAVCVNTGKTVKAVIEKENFLQLFDTVKTDVP